MASARQPKHRDRDRYPGHDPDAGGAVQDWLAMPVLMDGLGRVQTASEDCPVHLSLTNHHH
jgi:hypothetical protein